MRRVMSRLAAVFPPSSSCRSGKGLADSAGRKGPAFAFALALMIAPLTADG